MDPGGELRRGLVGGPRAIHPKEHLLREILRGGVVAGMVEEQRDEPILPGGHEVGKRLGIAVAHAEHEFRGGIARRPRHDR